ALGEPEALGAAREEAAVLGDRDLDLRADRPRRHREQREEAVRRRAGDDLEEAALLVGAEGGDQVLAPVLEEDRARPAEARQVHLRHAVEALVGARPPLFLLGQLDQPVEVPEVAPAQQVVGEHGEQGWAEREREPRGDAVALERPQHLEERDVGLGDRLGEPALLEEVLVRGVAHEGQVGVQDEGEAGRGHGARGGRSQRAVRGAWASLERERPSLASAALSGATLASGVPSQARALSRTASAAISTQRTAVSGDGVARGVVTTFERARGRNRPPGVARPISTQNEAAGRPTFRYQRSAPGGSS